MEPSECSVSFQDDIHVLSRPPEQLTITVCPCQFEQG